MGALNRDYTVANIQKTNKAEGTADHVTLLQLLLLFLLLCDCTLPYPYSTCTCSIHLPNRAKYKVILIKIRSIPTSPYSLNPWAELLFFLAQDPLRECFQGRFYHANWSNMNAMTKT